MKRKADKILMFVVVFLFLSGIIILQSASSVLSDNEFGEPHFFLKHQLIYGALVGVILGFFGYKIPYRFWKKIALPLFIGSLLLLILVFIPQFSYGSGGANRWIQFGSISVQPSELIKLTSIIYLAAWISSKSKSVKSIKLGVLPFIVFIGILGGILMLQPDFGTMIVIVSTAFLMFFVGRGRIIHIAGLGILGLLLAWKIIESAPYRLARLKAFLDPQLDPQGISYQINQALIAIGSGYIFGWGLGQSRQKFNFLPEPMNDSIFAIFAEETGFIGASILIIAFLIFAWRGIITAKSASDQFGTLLASGITTWIVLQAFINIGAISGLVPLTGIPLPFVSYGGTALAITLAASGILLNISKHTV